MYHVQCTILLCRYWITQTSVLSLYSTVLCPIKYLNLNLNLNFFNSEIFDKVQFLTGLISTFVICLQKTLGGKQHVPWITTHIKILIRRRQRRDNAAKKHNTNKNWKKYKEMRNLVRKTMNEAHDKFYVRQILNYDDIS